MRDAIKDRARRVRWNEKRRAMPKESIPAEQAIARVAEACAYYDEADVARWFARIERMTGRSPSVTEMTLADLRTFKKVPNEPFRKALERALQPLVMGLPDKFGENGLGPEFHALFVSELERVREQPPTEDTTKRQIGPTDMNPRRVTQWLQDNLGLTARQDGKGGIHVAWLLQYEVAEALAKTLGLAPHTVGI